MNNKIRFQSRYWVGFFLLFLVFPVVSWAQDGTISGTVTTAGAQPISGVEVWLLTEQCGGTVQASGSTDAEGHYTLTAPEGSYFVKVFPFWDPYGWYEPIWWDDAGGTTDCNAALPVDIFAGQETPDIDIVIGVPGYPNWIFTPEGDSRITSSPAIGSDGTIYVVIAFGDSRYGGEGYLYAINPDGGEKWVFEPGGWMTASPVIGPDDTIYILTPQDTLYAINPEDGTPKWQHPFPNTSSGLSTIGLDGTIYMAGSKSGEDCGLYALNPDGTLKWQYQTENSPTSPAVIGVDGTIYVVTEKKLCAINPNGTLKWIYENVGGSYITCSPAIGPDGTLYFGVANGYFTALNPDGTLRWSLSIESQAFEPALGADGTIYFSADNERIYAMSPDGILQWSYYTGRTWSSAPAVGSDGTIYVLRNTRSSSFTSFAFFVLNPDGSPAWQLGLGRGPVSSFSASPAIGHDGTVYLGVNGSLYALNSSSGGLADSSWPMLAHDAQHSGHSSQQTRTDPIPLTAGEPYEGIINSHDFADFALDVNAGQALLVEVVPEAGIDALTLGGKRGEVPVYPRIGDYSTEDTTPRGNYELVIDPTQAGTYYFSLFGDDVASVGGTYTITARYMDGHYLSDIFPRSAGNETSITVTLKGIGFAQDTQVTLQGDGLPQITQSKIIASTPTEMFVTFNLAGASPGFYDVQIDKPGESPSILESAFKVASGMPDQLRGENHVPPTVRAGRNYVARLEYENEGGAAMSAPLFIISNDADVPMRLSEHEPFQKGPLQVLGVNLDGPAGTLSPGDVQNIPIYFNTATPESQIEFTVERMTADSTPIDWDAIEIDVRPVDIDEDAWNAIWSNFKAQLGSTWAEYLQRLNEDATYISLYRRSKKGSLVGGELLLNPISDTSVYDVRALLGFELAKASGSIGPRSVLAAAQDVSVPAPGLPLSFSRFVSQSLPNRFRIGALGRGWIHIYEYTASIEENGDISIKGPGGYTRVFVSLSDGNYQALAGDYGTVSLAGNSVTLREKDGMIWQFDPTGNLSTIEDPNGNTLTLAYTGDNLTSIIHSNGESITLGYDGNGRIVQATDSAGRVSTYTYDASGEHLIDVERPGGIITSYSYNTTDGTPSAHALSSITFPDMTHHYYSYDVQGRLAAEWRDGDSERVIYAYDDQGTVTITDALTQSGVIRFGPYEEVLEIQDPLGRLVYGAFDGETQVSQLVNPDGKAISMAYDTRGNPVGIKNPLNQTVQMTFEHTLSRLTQLVDARLNEVNFTYNEAGNLGIITHPDSSVESFSYDGSGNIINYTNRRGDAIQYTYNMRGQLTQKVYPDGRTIDYQYDARGNLLSAIDSETGTIAMQYNARDFLTRIDYPDGYWLTFAYNNAGRRTQRVSHDGQVINYAYDMTGRLERLTDGSGIEFIRYEYDENGRLKTEIKGNGTRTTYEYDAAGQLEHMINYGPGGVVQSRFDYTYDENGNRTSMTTLDGTTYYDYDDIGQLVGVTYPDDHQVTYQYDASGNRMSVTDSGFVIGYTRNNMNQYTQVGNVSYTYDADGNMTSKTDSGGTVTYEYDVENRLVRIVTPVDGTWEYTYDALGNRISVNHDGVVLRYIHDPTDLVDVAAEYDGSGTLIARYTYGLGLVVRFDGAGNEAYYSFDGIGHTRQMTDSAGAVVNNYDYSPFGISLQVDETISNPFRYVGRFGVMEEGNGLQYMIARYYEPRVGRFLTVDPIPNPFLQRNEHYVYAYNNPITFIDPLGTLSLIGFGLLVGNAVLGELISPDAKELLEKWSLSTGGGPDIVTSAALSVPLVKHPVVGIGVLSLGAHILASKENPEYRLFGPVGRGVQIGVDRAVEFAKRYPKTAAAANSGLIGWIAQATTENFLKIVARGAVAGTTGLFAELTKAITNLIRPRDPNEKVGPPGVGDQHYVIAGEELPYTIYFENTEDATAPAQEVFINDTLDSDLDWSTFQLGEVAFGNQVVSSLSGSESGQDRVVLEDMAVDIIAELNPDTGLVSWTLRTLDLETGELPEDPFVGFLPPEDGTGRGQGYVTFTIRSQSDLPAETEIRNAATIVFDIEAPITTNEVFNTIADPPPAPPSDPGIPDEATDVPVSTSLSWGASEFATSYDLYFWEVGQPKPILPTASDLDAPVYDPPSDLNYDTTYLWQVVAKNIMGETEGLVWSFTTESLYAPGDINGDGLINIFDLQLVINCILGSGSCERCDLNDDGLYNIFDLQLVINAILGT